MIDFRNLSPTEKLQFIGSILIFAGVVITGAVTVVTKHMELASIQREAERKEAAEKLARENAERKEAAEKLAKENAERKEAAEKLARENAERKEAAEKLAKENAERKEAAEKLAKENAERKEAAEKQRIANATRKPASQQQATDETTRKTPPPVREPAAIGTDTDNGGQHTSAPYKANQDVGRTTVTARKDRIIADITRNGRAIELKCGVYSKINPFPLGDNEQMVGFARIAVKVCLNKAEEIRKLSGVIKSSETNELVKSNAGLFNALQQAKRIDEFNYLLNLYGR